VGAGAVVQALIGNAEPLHGVASDKVLADNLVGVGRGHVAVPDSLGIDHDHRSMLALVKASGLVDADFCSQASFFGELLEPGMDLALALRGAGAAGSASGTLVGTHKDMMLVRRHDGGPRGTFTEYGMEAARRD